MVASLSTRFREAGAYIFTRFMVEARFTDFQPSERRHTEPIANKVSSRSRTTDHAVHRPSASTTYVRVAHMYDFSLLRVTLDP